MERIGLQAILDMVNFDRGVRDYIEKSNQMEGHTINLKKTLGHLGDAVEKTAKVVAGAAVTGFAALIGIIASSKGPASDLNESMSKVTVVFAENADEIKAWSETAATSMGMSQQKALEAAGTYGNLFSAMGLSGDAAADMSMNLVKLAADLGSFNNIPVDEALEKLRAGLTGEAEPLKALGINMNEATLKTEALRMGLIKSTKDALEPAAKAQAAYSLIMKQSALAQGDFARTSDGLANQEKIVKAQIEDLRAEIGTAFLPVMTKLTGKFSDIIDQYGPRIVAVFDSIAQAVGGVVDFVLNFIAQLGQTEGVWEALAMAFEGTPFESLQAGFGDVQAAIEQVWSWISANLLPIFEKVISFVEENLKPILAGLAAALLAVVVPAFISWAASATAAATATIAALAPVLIPIAAIGAAVGLLVAAWENNWFGIRDALTAVWENTLKPALETLWSWLQQVIPPAIQALADFWNNVLVPALQAVWAFIQDKIIPIFQDVRLWLAENIPPILQALADLWTNVLLPAIQEVWAFIQDPVIPLFESIAELLDAVVGKAVEALAGLWQNVLQPALEEVWSWLCEKLQPVFEDVSSFIRDTVMPIIEELGTFIRDVVVPVVKDLAEKGLEKMRAAFDGVREALQPVIDFIKELADKIKNLELPDWLKPGSPTPFQLGLEGIADVLRSDLMKALEIFHSAFKASGELWAALTLAWRAILCSIYETSFPMLEWAANITFAALSSLVRAAASDLSQTLIPAIGNTVTALNTLADSLPAVRASFESTFTAEGGAVDQVRAATGAVGSLSSALSGIYSGSGPLPSLRDAFQNAFGGEQGITAMVQDAANAISDMTRNLSTARDRTAELPGAFTSFKNAAVPAVQDVIDELLGGSSGMALADRLRAVRDAAVDAGTRWKDSWQGVLSIINDMDVALQGVIDKLGTIGGSAQAATANLAAALAAGGGGTQAVTPAGAYGYPAVPAVQQRTVNLQFGNVAINNGMDWITFRAAVRQVVTEAIQYG